MHKTRVEAVMQVKRGSTEDWSATSYKLLPGQFGFEYDTGRFKIGNGVKTWAELPYFIDAQIIAELITSMGGGTTDPRVGELTELNTTVKDSIVNAVNEINEPTVPLTMLYTNAKAG